MVKIILPILVYIIVCVATLFVPTSEENNDLIWKLIVGQIYAIPALVIAILIIFLLSKKNI